MVSVAAGLLFLLSFLVRALLKAFLNPLQPVNYGLLYGVRECFGNKAWHYHQNCLKQVSAAKSPPQQ